MSPVRISTQERFGTVNSEIAGVWVVLQPGSNDSYQGRGEIQTEALLATAAV
jgi:hypothetical protein